MPKNPEPPQPQARQQPARPTCIRCGIEVEVKDRLCAHCWMLVNEAAQPQPEPAKPELCRNLIGRYDGNEILCNKPKGHELPCEAGFGGERVGGEMTQPLDKPIRDAESSKFEREVAAPYFAKHVWPNNRTGYYDAAEFGYAVYKAAHQLAERALDSHLPAGYAIGDEATATLAVQLAEREAEVATLEAIRVGQRDYMVKLENERAAAESREQRFREALQLCLTELWRVPAQGYDKWRLATSAAEKALNPSKGATK
jgi:hypothetical protein